MHRDLSFFRASTLAFTSVFAAGALEAAPAPDASQPYVFFIGAEVKIVREGTSAPLQSYSRGTAVIEVDGNVVRLSDREMSGYEIRRVPRVSRTMAQIGKVKLEPAYSLDGEADIAMRQAMVLDDMAAEKADRDARMPGMIEDAVARESMTKEEGEAALAQLELDRPITDGIGYTELRELAEEKGADCFDLEFDVSANEPREGCHVVAYCVLKLPNRRQASRMVLLQEAGRLTSEPRRIRIRSPRLAAGFEVAGYSLHLFSRDEELATNLSAKRLTLSEAQAFQYLNLQYAAEHKGETLPPVVLHASIPEHRARTLTPQQLERNVRVTVNAQGAVTSVKDTGDLPAWTVQAIERFHFHPALEAGKPVPGATIIVPREHVR